jgi:hypothetical protein
MVLVWVGGLGALRLFLHLPLCLASKGLAGHADEDEEADEDGQL